MTDAHRIYTDPYKLANITLPGVTSDSIFIFCASALDALYPTRN
jgi:hypothetical protein